MQLPALLLVAAFLPSQAAGPAAPATALLPDCLVTLIEEAHVPAQEPGVLKKIPVRQGQAVEAGELLAQVDETKILADLRVAQAKLKAAQEKAGDDINVRYAKAASLTARAEYNFNLEANQRVPGSVPKARLNELELKCKETELAIDKAQLEWRVAGFEADAAKAEVEAAQENVNHRQVRSPLPGVVVMLHRHEGEWVQPGDQVLRVIRMDRLWVDGYLSASEFTRADVDDRPATVKVNLARGRQISVVGKIVYASPTTEAGGKFLVRAEIENRNSGGHWVLNPGLNASMSIPLK